MNENLESKISNFFVANLRNSWLLRAIRVLNLNILNLNLFRPDLIRDSLITFVVLRDKHPACRQNQHGAEDSRGGHG
jgi:hypothetical protein